MEIKKVDTISNLADLLTKPLPHAVTEAFLAGAGLLCVESRGTLGEVKVAGGGGGS